MEIEIRNIEIEGTKYTLAIIGKIWYKKDDKNYLHREDGPAVIYDNGEEQWWYYNKAYINFDWSHSPEKMPLNLFLAYCKWEYNKNGS